MRLIDGDELLEHAYRDRLDTRERIADMIRNAPTIDYVVQKVPIRAKGKWINRNNYYYCSNCNNMALNYDDCSEGKLKTDFCPYCGTDMRESEDKE